MKNMPRPSPAMIVALLALFVSLGGSAVGYNIGRETGSNQAKPSKAKHRVRYRLRAGKIFDTDTTAGDGSFNYAQGRARCKHGERLISGGVRLRGGPGGVFPGQHVSLVDSSPAPKNREWGVTMNSDLGGAARQRFAVFAYCKSG
jgi:hypothetical protein